LGDEFAGMKNVVSYLPLAINLDPTTIGCLSGPTQILYDTSGGNPQYY
jgi:hypothetical protein